MMQTSEGGLFLKKKMVIFQCYLEYFFLASTKYPFHLQASADRLAVWQFLDLKTNLL